MSVSTRPVLAFVLLVAGTVLGLSGIDLVLPAIPDLPAELGGSEASAQLVIAAYVAGTAIGLILFGSLGARFGRRNCLVAGLAIFAALSALGTLMPNMPSLIGLRLVQGIASAAPAVFAPGIIKALFDEAGAIRAMGLFSSIESIVPAAAPIVGLWLLSLGGWQLSFTLTAVLAALLALVLRVFGGLLPPSAGGSGTGSYWRLMRSPVFLRYCVSQALVVGGLLIFVFGAPVVIVNAMGGTISDFIIMQVAGISCFVAASNTTGLLVTRFGAETMIWLGTALAALGGVALLAFATWGNGDPIWLAVLFIPVNAGLGFRGPPGFFRAILAGHGDDDRAASLTILAILLVAAGGTALLAPWISHGLIVLAGASCAVLTAALGAMAVWPKLEV